MRPLEPENPELLDDIQQFLKNRKQIAEESEQLDEGMLPIHILRKYGKDGKNHILWQNGNYSYNLSKAEQNRKTGGFDTIKRFPDHSLEDVHDSLLKDGYKLKKMLGESYQLDELKASTLASYIKKAASIDKIKNAYGDEAPEIDDNYGSPYPYVVGQAKTRDALDKADKRHQGITKAADNLVKGKYTKEDISESEFLDDISSFVRAERITEAVITHGNYTISTHPLGKMSTENKSNHLLSGEHNQSKVDSLNINDQTPTKVKELKIRFI